MFRHMPASLARPGQTVPALRRARLPLRERRVGLSRLGGLRFDAGAVLQGEIRPHVHGALLDAGARHEDHARPVAGADERVLGVRWAVHEVPCLQRALFAFDQREALAREDEEVLLVRLAVVPAARLARQQDRDRVADVRERDLVSLEDARRPEHIVVDPSGVADVDDEPAVRRRGEAVIGLLEPRLYWFHLSAVFLPWPLLLTRGSLTSGCFGAISPCERRADPPLPEAFLLPREPI